jgi:glycosyltransferase involved in cell wall biosynthesis
VKVAVVNLTRGGFSGGYRKYLGRIVPLLAADPRVQQLCLAMPPGVPFAGLTGIETITWPPGDERRGYRALRQGLWRLSPDVVFIPTARWLDCGSIPTVVMVRNMEPLTVPFGGNSFLEGIRNLARAHAARVACRRASRVVAVSRHVRDFVARRWKISPARVGVVYHGADPLISESIAAPSWALDNHQAGRFLFTAGSIRPARGLEDVIQALGCCGTDHPTSRLVIAGRADRGTAVYERRMRRLAAAQGAARVLWAGQLTSAEMAWCFQQCAAYVTTSRAEACPNTALEAMHNGCLVVSTRQAPMPEVFGDAAVYYEPGNAEDLTVQLRRLFAAEPEERTARREALRERASRFQWRETADRTIEELVLATAPGGPNPDRESEGPATK